jgi:urease accessory protein
LPDSAAVAVRDAVRHPLAHDQGRLHLGFAAGTDGVTRLSRQFASYPFHLCRPFRFAGDPPAMATLYVQSCSGGVYEGDRLSVRIEAPARTQVHVTTQAATIVRSMRGAGARQETVLEAGPGSLLEYLPDPLILFPQARLEASLLVRADRAARVLTGEAFLLHDPLALARPFAHLSSVLQVEERGSGCVLFRDRISVAGEDWTARAPGVTGEAAGTATLVILSPDAPGLISGLRSALAAVPDLWSGASLLPRGAGGVCRFLARDGRALRAGLDAVWRTTRRHWTGSEPQPRRK